MIVNSLRLLLLRTHRWLGLASSVVLSIVGVTGAVLVWTEGSLLRRIANGLHQELAIGAVGRWIVVASTLAAFVLAISGLYLWWKRKTLAVRTKSGWRLALVDLHHVIGVVFLPIMLVLSLSGVGMGFRITAGDPEARRALLALHTADGWPLSVKLVYTAGTTGFLIQGITGIVMWWKPGRRTNDRPLIRRVS